MEADVTGLADLDALIAGVRQGEAQAIPLARFVAAYTEALDRAIPRRAGRLRASVRVNAAGDRALFEATAPYALYVLLGVRAQYMTWLVGKTVAFTPKGGGPRIVRRVARVGVWGGRSHWYRPETPPNDFFRAALDDPRVARLSRELADAGTPVQVAYTYRARG